MKIQNFNNYNNLKKNNLQKKEKKNITFKSNGVNGDTFSSKAKRFAKGAGFSFACMEFQQLLFMFDDIKNKGLKAFKTKEYAQGLGISSIIAAGFGIWCVLDKDKKLQP